MGWSKPEQEIIRGLVDTSKKIESALIGDLETKEPGLIDDVRELKTGAEKAKTAFYDNRKQHIMLFGLVGVGITITLMQAFGGDVTKIIEIVLRIFK